MPQINILKATGVTERFDKKKIEKTCLRAGASKQFAREIANKIKEKIYEGISTKEILKLILNLLKGKPEVRARYNLKSAIMNLGPSGFPFEEYFSQILKSYGYETKVGQIFKGKNITHEIDVSAKKDSRYMIECKYHNAIGTHTGVKVALYVYARFLDLKKEFDVPWLATNTKCSPDVQNYAKGVGMKITSWEYPKGESLQKLIENKGLYPITILPSVRGEIKEKLAKAKIIFAKSLTEINFEDLKNKTNLQESVLRRIVEEARRIVYQ